MPPSRMRQRTAIAPARAAIGGREERRRQSCRRAVADRTHVSDTLQTRCTGICSAQHRMGVVGLPWCAAIWTGASVGEPPGVIGRAKGARRLTVIADLLHPWDPSFLQSLASLQTASS